MGEKMVKNLEHRINRSVTLLIICMLALTLALSGCSKANAETDGADNSVTVYDAWDEAAAEMLSITSGAELSRTAFTFAYSADEGFRSVSVYCDVYVNGEKTEDGVRLLTCRFADGLEGYPHAGKLLIDLLNKKCCLSDEFYYMGTYITEDGELSDEAPIRQIARAEGAFDADLLRNSYRSAYFSTVNGGTSGGNIVSGEPVYLLWVAESADDNAHLLAHGKPAEEIIADTDLMAGFEQSVVFYCIFG